MLSKIGIIFEVSCIIQRVVTFCWLPRSTVCMSFSVAGTYCFKEWLDCFAR